jgi:hypothetical protein
MSESPTLAQVLASLPEEERIILTLHYMPERAVDAVISAGKARLSAVLGL